MAHSGVLDICERRWGPPNVAGNLSPIPLPPHRPVSTLACSLACICVVCTSCVRCVSCVLACV